MAVKLCRAGWIVLLLAAAVHADDLKVGDRLPACDKIPLLPMTGNSFGRGHDLRAEAEESIESLLPDSGGVLVHFTAPRPTRNGPFKTYLAEEITALSKAVLTTSYRCRALVILSY